MPYHVEYFNTDNQKQSPSGFRRFALTICLFLLFCVLVSNYWPEGVSILKQSMLPDETLQAVEVFAQELNCGYSITDAVRNLLTSMKANAY